MGLFEGFGHLGICKFNFRGDRAGVDKFFTLVRILEIAINSRKFLGDLEASVFLTDHLEKTNNTRIVIAVHFSQGSFRKENKANCI